MATPSPEPTTAELVLLAEILQEPADTVLDLVSADAQDISDAKWALTLTDLDSWPAIRDEANDIKKVGSIEFFEGVAGQIRLNFINNVRRRYGLDVLISEAYGVQAAMTSLNWF
jgi:hypothetical protein